MTPTRWPKTPPTWMRSGPTCAGWASTGEGREYYASDYFDQLYDFAVKLIKDGKAYVDDTPVDEIRRMRGVPTQAGEESAFRDRSVAENLDLFARMKDGEFPEGSAGAPCQDRYGLAQHAPARSDYVPAFCTSPTTAPATAGLSTRPTIGPTDRATPSRESPIQSAPWSLRCIAPFT